MPTTTPFANLITFSRGSNATVVGPNGLVQWAPSNLLTFSEQFDNAAWSKTAVTVTANAAVAPDGTTTADALVETTATSTHQIFRLPGLGVNTYTYSFYAKASGRTQVQVEQESGGNARFTLTGTGTALALGANTVSITSVGNGWYRCSTTFTVTGAFGVYLLLYNGSTNNYTGDGTSGVLLWGAQLELGSTATTYNPTTVKNLLGFSEAFDNAAWTKTRASIVTGAAANPINGLFNAQKLMEDTTASNSHFIVQPGTGIVANTRYVQSVYAKAGERSWLYMTEGNNVTAQAWFNLASGVVGTVTGTGSPAATITAIGNGWYRCSLAFTPIAAAANVQLRVVTGNNVANYTGDGNSGIYIYGAQLSDSASLDPYVPTPGAAPSSTAYYGPRFDYDPATLQPRGILIEEQRTNLLLRSEEFDNVAWTKTRSSITANATTSPDGTVDADKLVEDTTAAASHFVSQNIASHTSGVSYTMTVYAKAAERSQIRVNGDAAIGLSIPAIFDLSSGTVVSAGSFTASIQNAGNGWYRCVCTGTATATSAGVWVVGIAVAGNTSYTGDGTSGIFVYGAQLEVGAFATSYIPTIASTVTRSADVATITGQNFGQFYRQDEGCLVVEGSVYSTGLSGNRKTLAAITEGNFNNASRTAVEGATSAGASVISGGVTQAAFTVGSAVAANTPFKMALAMKANDFAFCANGGAVSTDTSGSVVSAPIVLDLGFGPQNSSGSTNTAGDQLNGWLRAVRYIPVRAADFQLQALTT